MKVDLHVHTWYSLDSGNPPSKVLRMMDKRGIDAVAITNHNLTYGYSDLPKDRVIPGIEFSTLNGHLLGLWVEEDYYQKKKLIDMDTALDIIHDNDGLSIIAHPFDIRRGWKFDRRDIYYARKIDGIEVCNSKNKAPDANDKALEMANKYRLVKTAGSDSHFPLSVGLSYVSCEASDLEEFRKNLTAGKCDIHCGMQNPIMNGITFIESVLQEKFSLFGRSV